MKQTDRIIFVVLFSAIALYGAYRYLSVNNHTLSLQERASLEKTFRKKAHVDGVFSYERYRAFVESLPNRYERFTDEVSGEEIALMRIAYQSVKEYLTEEERQDFIRRFSE